MPAMPDIKTRDMKTPDWRTPGMMSIRDEVFMVRTWKAWLLTAGIAAALARGGIRADEPAKPAPDKPAAPATDKPQPPAEEPKRDAPKPGTDKPEVKAGASDVLDDVAEPFVPAHPRSGREEDRVRALALFAAARVAEQKQDYPLALRNYERALRFDPDALPALRDRFTAAAPAGASSDGRRGYGSGAGALRESPVASRASQGQTVGRRGADADGDGPALFS